MTFSVGDLVILKSGSMRMVVESVSEDGAVSTVWCNDGTIGRDSFDPLLLSRAEPREDRGGHGAGHRDDRGPRHGHGHGHGHGPRGDDRGHRGDDRGHRGRDRDDHRGGRDRDDRPPRKQGWDGKPRDKKYFRKDD